MNKILSKTFFIICALFLLGSLTSCSEADKTPDGIIEDSLDGEKETQIDFQMESDFSVVDENDHIILENLCVGECVTFGQYEQDNNNQNGSEPIEWTVLEIDKGKALLVSNYVLEVMPYHDVRSSGIWYESITWETCTLREWLNDSFFNAAFSTDEQELILLAHLDNTGMGQVGNETDDKVFISSIYDLIDLYGEDIYREWYTGAILNQQIRSQDLFVEPTEYAIERLQYKSYLCTITPDNWSIMFNDYSDDMIGKTGICWWTRTQAERGMTYLVEKEGEINLSVQYGPDAEFGIRPSIWVKYDNNMDSEEYFSQNTNNSGYSALEDDNNYEEYNDKPETQVEGKEYFIYPYGAEFVKQGEDYYLCPPEIQYESYILIPDDNGECISFDEPLRISKDAEVGLTKDIEEIYNGQWNEYVFSYEYYDFDKIVEKLFNDNRWYVDEYKWLYFDYKDNRIPLTPKIVLDEKGEIIMFKEYNDQIVKWWEYIK